MRADPLRSSVHELFVFHVMMGMLQIYKVRIFWEGHKILRNLTFVYSTYRQKLGGDFATFVAFSEYVNFTGLYSLRAKQ